MEVLPLELRCALCSFLPPSALLSLSLTSWSLHEAAYPDLEKRLLATPLWLWVSRKQCTLTLGYYEEPSGEFETGNGVLHRLPFTPSLLQRLRTSRSGPERRPQSGTRNEAVGRLPNGVRSNSFQVAVREAFFKIRVDPCADNDSIVIHRFFIPTSLSLAPSSISFPSAETTIPLPFDDYQSAVPCYLGFSSGVLELHEKSTKEVSFRCGVLSSSHPSLPYLLPPIPLGNNILYRRLRIEGKRIFQRG